MASATLASPRKPAQLKLAAPPFVPAQAPQRQIEVGANQAVHRPTPEWCHDLGALAVRFTVDEFHRIEEIGILANEWHGERTELIDGRIVWVILGDSLENPIQIKPSHVWPISVLTNLVPTFAAQDTHLRLQNPVTLPEFDEPMPDAAIVRGTMDDFLRHHPLPEDILCLIEVADASASRDRGVKLRAYAAAGVPLYVILHLPSRTAEVYRDPIPAAGRYGRSETLAADAALRLPTAAGPLVEVTVGDLLPAVG